MLWRAGAGLEAVPGVPGVLSVLALLGARGVCGTGCFGMNHVVIFMRRVGWAGAILAARPSAPGRRRGTHVDRRIFRTCGLSGFARFHILGCADKRVPPRRHGPEVGPVTGHSRRQAGRWDVLSGSARFHILSRADKRVRLGVRGWRRV